jgi:hypothetical protein
MFRVLVSWAVIAAFILGLMDWAYDLSERYNQPNPNRAVIVVPKEPIKY